MKDLFLLQLRKFLTGRLIPGKPLLIGYSGGPDSKALLHLLLECRRFFSFELHAAHIDHGWRKESGEEAELIRKEMAAFNLPFHLNSLSLSDFHPGNTEEQGRRQRLEFFKEIYSEIGAQALLLAHHAGDQSETVLKRVFEGASLFSLSGLSIENTLEGMQVWRPFLFREKKEILDWLSKRNLNYFDDSTNRSLKFLRGKMREELFPMITASFGKKIAANLCRMGEEAKELKEYFQDLNRPILESISGGRLDLNAFLPMPSIRLKFLLKGWLEQEKISLSREIIEGIAGALNQGASQKKFYSREGEFNINNGSICFCKNLNYN